MKVAIIGAGNMGMAFAKSFIQYNLIKKESLYLIEKNEDRATILRNENAGAVVDTINPKIGEYDLIILSVKPQDFIAVASELQQVIQPNQLVLSIMAGISIEKIQTLLSHPLVVRAMPNTPALLGMGMTAFSAAGEITLNQLKRVENLINSTGRAVFLEDESLLDAVTALSGSGPAYFFYLVKAMIEAGKQMGFEESMSAILVKQTMLGSFHLINNSDKNLDELIKAVASKGGTTEAALKRFEEGLLAQNLKEGIFAAQKRATELSK
jgi:pyrroline-5-carboxylate reductase